MGEAACCSEVTIIPTSAHYIPTSHSPHSYPQGESEHFGLQKIQVKQCKQIQVWWLAHVTSVLRRETAIELCEFKTSLVYIVSSKPKQCIH